MGKVYVVVGAGFRGYCDTLQLLQESDAKIYVVDRCLLYTSDAADE